MLHCVRFKIYNTPSQHRVLSDVHTCDLWKWYEDRLRVHHPSAVIAALQFYSDKTLLNMKGKAREWGPQLGSDTLLVLLVVSGTHPNSQILCHPHHLTLSPTLTLSPPCPPSTKGLMHILSGAHFLTLLMGRGLRTLRSLATSQGCLANLQACRTTSGA